MHFSQKAINDAFNIASKAKYEKEKVGVGEVGGVQGGLVLVQGDGGQARHDSVPALSQDPQDDLQLLRGAEQYIQICIQIFEHFC